MIGNDVWLCSSWFKQKTQDGQKVLTFSKHKKLNICQIWTHLKQIRSPMKEKSLFKPPQCHILIYQVPLAILFGDYTNLSSDTAAMLFQFVLLSMTDIKTFHNYNFTISAAASKK